MKHNRLCVAVEKSKLLVLGTGEMRAAKLFGQEMKISVDRKKIPLAPMGVLAHGSAHA